MEYNPDSKRKSEKPFNFYGVRETRNKKYMSVTLVRGNANGERQWLNVPVNIKNVIIKDGVAFLRLGLLESTTDYNEVAKFQQVAPTTKASRAKAMSVNEDLSF